MKRQFAASILLILFVFPLMGQLLPLLLWPAQARAQGTVTVYFSSWNVYSSSYGQVKDLPWNKIDCVNHAFWKVAPKDGGYAVVSADPWADTDEDNAKAHFPQYAKYAKKYPQVKIVLSIGGWTCCGYFSEMASTAAGRASFIQSCVDTLEQYPFLSGLDIDWEYPGVARRGSGSDEGNPVKGDDFVNYTLLLKELRSALDERFGKGKKLLTVCAAADEGVLAKQDYAALFPYVNCVNLMTYDLVTSSSGITGHHTALFGAVSADTAVKYLQKQGVPASKIAIGSPLYSHGWKLRKTDGGLVGVAAGRLAGSEKKWHTLHKLEQAAVAEGTPGWHTGYDEDAQAAYLWNDDPDSDDFGAFYSYESSRSLAAKLTYARVHSLGGIIVWESGGDDAPSGWPMLKQMHDALHP